MNTSVFSWQRFGAALGAAFLVAGLLPASAQDKTTMPDAQVEANVLRQLATAPELSTQNIQSATVYGTVTLTGNVQDEVLRTKAENLVARADGVKKVVDELALGSTPAAPVDDHAAAAPNSGAPGNDPGNGMVLQSDGTYAPAPPDDQTQPAPAEANNQPPVDTGDPAYANAAPPNGAAPNQAPNGNGAPDWGPAGPPPGRQPMYGNGYAAGPNGPQGGQQAGVPVTVPGGVVLQVRINRGLDSNHVAPGTPFTGTVMNDVVAGGAVAIPRGAQIQGTVVDAKKAGTFKGQGELALQLNSLTLGGQTYPLTTVAWSHEGADKTIRTVNSAVGGGALGALFGAAAGGGAGAAIGAGIGGALGVANSASSPRGRVIVPPESMLTFHLAQPISLTTVSQQEMARLSYAAGPPPPPPGARRRYYNPYYGPYYGPAY